MISMKKIVCFFSLIILIAVVLSANQDPNIKEFEPKKFKVTIEIIYNGLTLEEASEKERTFKEQFKDACKIDINLDNGNMINYTTETPQYFYLDTSVPSFSSRNVTNTN